MRPGALRGELRRVGGLTLLVDCYNANPQSVRAALDTLADLEARARVAFLGSMLELGDRSAPLHQDVLHYALDTRLERVVATGDFARAAEAMADEAAVDEALAGDPPRLLVRATPDEAYDVLAPTLAGDEAVLLKASRGVALERLLPRFEADFGAAHAAAGGEG
ncbi:MAG: hypothetical protein D6701_06575 [Gemmatimonadetes bacterium]|nr:MAG: hypothetical protein D6701_06575 [Gemmatimonadota bacterium]